jgi:hypothetical protein
MVEPGKSMVDELRQQPFYRGQILSVQNVAGRLADSVSSVELFKPGELGHMQGSSMPKLLKTLGMEEIYTGLKGGWRIAFPSTGVYSDDVILKAPKGLYRETFWQIITLVEALDFGRCSLVVCRNANQAEAVHSQLSAIIKSADISYAVNAAKLLRSEDYQVFAETFPQILVTTPVELLALLLRPTTDGIRARILRALSRIVFPSAEEWPPALASNTAFVMRKLNLECLLVGSPVSAVVTIDPCPNAEDFVQELIGRSIRQENVVSGDGVETVPSIIAFCSGAMVRDVNDSTRWVREPLSQFAAGKETTFFASDAPVTAVESSKSESLLAFLAGDDKHSPSGGCELHYVLDVSGSMAGVLPDVVESVISDLQRKVEKGTIGASSADPDHLRLSVFDEGTTEVFSSDFGPDAMKAFENAARAQTVQGGTDIPQALVSALRASIASGRELIEMILFSDGYSPISDSTKNSLVRLLRDNRARGVAIGIVYVALDFDPPQDVVNLIERELGGVVLKVSQAELSACSYGSGVLDDSTQGTHVVILSGERGLPASVIQPYQGRKRKLVFTRDISTLTENPRQVHSVVVSGRFPSAEEIITQISRMGRRRIPVFVLLEAEASSRFSTESFPEQAGLWRVPLAYPENPHSRSRMLQVLVDDEMDVFHYRYLVMGDTAFPQLKKYIEGALKPEDKAAVWRSITSKTPEGFHLLRRNDKLLVRREKAVDRTAVLDMRTFTDDTISLSGQTVSTVRDKTLSALLFHEGARLDVGNAVVQCAAIKDGQIPLGPLTRDIVFPIINVDSIAFLDADGSEPDHRDVERLGRLSKGRVRVNFQVLGRRPYPQGNLDASPQDDYDPASLKVTLETRGMVLRPVGSPDPSVLSGLANSLKVAAVTLFRYAEQTVFVHHQNGAIWVFDLAPGGNGAVELLFGNRAILPQLFRLGGRILLECPCEGGWRGATTQATLSGASFDNGCPRCVRQAGVVVKDEIPLSKRATLEWLLAQEYLPGSAKLHIAEKYDDGIQDLRRIAGGDMGSRKGCLRLVRRIMRDRLGLDLPDGAVADFDWLAEDGTTLGQYDASANKLKILKELKEWAALDVLAHEFFHNVQHKIDGLFCGEKLGAKALDTPPRDGLLFEEGAAVWAESHVMDTLALRSCLDLANLREGDQYGDGFRLFKWIEEKRGGVQAVLTFMQLGYLPGGKGCPDETWRDLMRAAGII